MAKAVRRPGCEPRRRAFKGRATLADIDRRCTIPGRLARKRGGPCARPGVPRDPTKPSSTASSRAHRKSDAARPRRGVSAAGPNRPRGQLLRDPLLSCDWGTRAVHRHRIPTGRAQASQPSGAELLRHRSTGASPRSCEWPLGWCQSQPPKPQRERCKASISPSGTEERTLS
jgi:hypothetical protein